MYDEKSFLAKKNSWDGAIFDLDGTLLDSMSAWDTVALDYLRSLGVTPRAGWRDDIKTMNLLQIVHYFRREYGVTKSVPGIIMGITRVVKQYYKNVVLKPGARELLYALREAGIRLCIATANNHRLAKKILRKNGVLSCFSFLLTCKQAGAGKDQPDLYERALRILGTAKKRTIVFEDALHAISTAKSAGFTVAAVYDASAEDDQRAIRDISDFYISSYYDLGNVIC